MIYVYFKSSPLAICYEMKYVSLSSYVYWYSFYREYSIVPGRYEPLSSKHIQRCCLVCAIVLLLLLFEKVYGTNELGRRRASATSYNAGKLGGGWVHFKLWQMTGVWRIPSFLAAGTTTAKRFGCVAEGTTKAGWYRASGGRVLGCWTTLAKVENVFTTESSKSSKDGIIWNPWMQIEYDGIPKMKILKRSQECNTSVTQEYHKSTASLHRENSASWLKECQSVQSADTTAPTSGSWWRPTAKWTAA